MGLPSYSEDVNDRHDDARHEQGREEPRKPASPAVRSATQRDVEKLRSEIVDLRRQVSELTKARVELDKRLAVVAREKAELTIRVEQLDKLTRRLQRLGGRRHGG